MSHPSSVMMSKFKLSLGVDTRISDSFTGMVNIELTPDLAMHISSGQAKQKAMEDLTPGQAAVLARNEQEIEKAMEELEDFEEMLNESIADSIRGKRQKTAAAADGGKKKRRSAAHSRVFLMAALEDICLM